MKYVTMIMVVALACAGIAQAQNSMFWQQEEQRLLEDLEQAQQQQQWQQDQSLQDWHRQQMLIDELNQAQQQERFYQQYERQLQED